MPSSRSSRTKPVKGGVKEVVSDLYAARLHSDWLREFRRSHPAEKRKPRMRLRGGVMVDINKPWASLDPKAKADNKHAAYAAYDAVKRFPDDREAASEYVHQRWIARNKGDKSQPKALFKAYARLPEVEKDKDRAHVDRMTAALRTVSPKKARKAKAKTTATKTVRLDAKTWARLEAAAKSLSNALGRTVTPEALLVAGAEAVAAVAKSGRAKKA